MATKIVSSSNQTIRHRIKTVSSLLTRSERKIAQLLSQSNVSIALDTIYDIAAKAGVSPPTVLRFATKLGFKGFGDFHRALVNELQQIIESPSILFNQTLHVDDKAEENEFGEELVHSVKEALNGMLHVPQVLALLANQKNRIFLKGGRFSQCLAQYMHAHLQQMRSQVFLLGQNSQTDINHLLDMGKKDVVLLFDFRRYQQDTIDYGHAVAKQGAKIILFTDRWLSPISQDAEYFFTAEVATSSAFDSIVAATAQVEYLLKHLLKELGRAAQIRLSAIDNLRMQTWKQ